MARSITQLFTSFRDWFTSVENSDKTITPRKWCLLEFTEALTMENIRKFFDRKALNEEYVLKVKNRSGANQKAYAHLQLEINAIYSTHKSFASRHKTRLQCYTDDLSQKAYRTKASLSFVEGKMRVFKTNLSK